MHRPLPILLQPVRHVLGVVGAGGIGQSLSHGIRINDWNQACLMIILITVAVIDAISHRLRRGMIGGR